MKNLNKTNSQLEKILWKWFSLFIRLRDSDYNGMCVCITCGKIFHYKSGDAGHFISRNHKSTKYDEKNVNAQCAADNRFQSGKQYEHGLAIDKKYGHGTAEFLLLKSKMVCKRKASDFIYMIGEYKLKAKNEAKRKKIIL